MPSNEVKVYNSETDLLGNEVDNSKTDRLLDNEDSDTSPSTVLTIARILWAAVFLGGALGEAVCFKHVSLAADQYPMALVMLLAVTGLVAYPVVVLIGFFSGCVEGKQIWVTWWKPAIVGLCFVLHDILLKTGGRGDLPGVLILVLGKLAIPCSMLFSMLPWTLDNKYGTVHWIALALLFIGVIVTVYKHMAFTGDHDATVGGDAFKVLLVASSAVPLAVAFVFLEKWLKNEDKHMYPVAFWMWACAFMVPLALIFAPVNAVLAGVPSKDIWPNLYDGIRCYALGEGPPPDRVGKKKQDCPSAHFFWCFAILFAFVMNVAMPLCTKYGSATFLWFVKALTVPFGGILFSMSMLMGDAARPMAFEGWVGLVFVTLAVALFNYEEPTKRN